MKIAIIINLFPPKWLGGMEIATYNLAEHLSKRGHEIHIITLRDAGLPIFQHEKGFYIHRVTFPRIRIIGVICFWLNICRIIWRINPDILLVQSIGIGIPALLTKKLLKIPYVIWGRGDDVYRPGRFIRITARSILMNADSVLALTENMRKRMMNICPREISIVPNGINLEQFSVRSPTRMKEEGTKNILFVGRLHPVKGVQYLIRAMKKVLEEIPDAKLILVGDGEERERLEALSIQLGIQKSVHFIGIVPHEMVHTFMHQADVFVLPSLSEGFPNVLLEAMACKLPVVATRVGGIPDIIEDGTNGYIVEVNDSQNIADRILFILKNEILMNEFSVNNEQKVKNYTWDAVIFNLEEIFRLYIN